MWGGQLGGRESIVEGRQGGEKKEGPKEGEGREGGSSRWRGGAG